MSDSFKDLDFSDLDEEKDAVEQISAKLKEKLGVSLEEMTTTLSTWVQEHADEVVLDFVNIAPFEDYGKMLEDNEGMAEFLKTEAHKPEHWQLHFMGIDTKRDLFEVIFSNVAVDDGDSLRGYVFVSPSGKIRHAFAQAE